MLILIFIFIFGLCWGSFLNMLAYRLVHARSLSKHRSQCPHCNTTIAWYDNVPVISWIVLKAQCRHCKQSISPLYPFIELLTAYVITGIFYTKIIVPCFPLILLDSDVLWFLPASMYLSFLAYVLFFSALIAAMRTDLEAMVIPQCFTLWLVPFGVLFAYEGFLDISWFESIVAAGIGYGSLWIVATLFKRIRGIDGMGVGDMELLATVGAFLGLLGVWISLLIASCTGVICGFLYLKITKKTVLTRIPFGPFLALGAGLYFFYGHYLIQIL